MKPFESLGLSDRVQKALSDAGVAGIRELARYTKQELIDLPGVGATSADRILSALDVWFAELEAIALRVTPAQTLEAIPLTEEPVVLELLEACVWAKDVLYNIGGQRGMFLGAQMRMKIEAVQEVLTLPVLSDEDIVTEIVEIG